MEWVLTSAGHTIITTDGILTGIHIGIHIGDLTGHIPIITIGATMIHIGAGEDIIHIIRIIRTTLTTRIIRIIPITQSARTTPTTSTTVIMARFTTVAG